MSDVYDWHQLAKAATDGGLDAYKVGRSLRALIDQGVDHDSKRLIVATVAMHAMVVHGETKGRNADHIRSQSFAIADAMVGRAP